MGIDEFGNYSNPTEGRVGGPGYTANSVAVRGPGSGSTGYAYIAGSDTLKQSLDRTKVTKRPNQDSEHYRRAQVRLEPSSSGYTVAAYVQFGQNTPLIEVVPPTLIGQNPPATLKMGFAASTGGATNYHEVRDLSLSTAALPTVIKGKVTDAKTGGPIAGASVQVVDAEGHVSNTSAAGDGTWSLSSASVQLAAGPATVAVSYAGYCRSTATVNLSSGVDNVHNAALQPAVLTGTVRDAGTDVPLVGATVVMTDSVGATFTTISGVAGAYSFTNGLANPFVVGAVTLSAAKSHYATAVRGATLTNCGPNVLIIPMRTTDLWFYKTDGRPTASAGEMLTYTIRIENHGSMPASGIKVTDTVRTPSYVTFADATPGYVANADTRVWALSTPLAVGASIQLTMVVRVNDQLPDGTFTIENYAYVGTASPEADLTNNEQSDLTSFTAHPNLVLHKRADPGAVPVGAAQTLTYTLQIENRGSAVATGVVLTDDLDAQTVYDAGSAEMMVSGLARTITVTQQSPSLVVELPPLAPNASGVLSYTVQTAGSLIPGTTSIHNEATLVAVEDDADADNDSSAADVPALAGVDAWLSASALPAPFPARTGGSVVYTIHYGNSGSTAASGVLMTVTIPANTSYVPGSLRVNGGTVADPTVSGRMMNPLQHVGTTLAAQSTGVLSYTLRVASVLPAGVETLTGAFQIGTAEVDLHLADNVAGTNTIVAAAPDLAIVKSDGLTAVVPGASATYVITYSNVGDQGATGVDITDTLISGLAYVPGSVSDSGYYNPADRTITWNLLSVPVGGPHTMSYQATADATDLAEALASNEVVIADDGANGTDPHPGNNRAVDVDRVVRPYVVMDKQFSDPLAVGESVTMTIGYRNLSPVSTAGWTSTLTDTLPDYWDILDAGGANVSGNTLTWGVPVLPPFGQGQQTVVARLAELPTYVAQVVPTFPRELQRGQVVITSTLSDVPSLWAQAGVAEAPTLRVLWQDGVSDGPTGWKDNPQMPGAPSFAAWTAPVPAGIEHYWYPEGDLEAQWVAHDSDGHAEPNYSFFRHLFYLPLNAVQPSMTAYVAGDDLPDVYVNGVYAGHDYGGGAPTTLTDTVNLQPGANLLAVRLLNNDHGGHSDYPDPFGTPTCHQGLLYQVQADYSLRPFALAPSVARAGDPLVLTIDTNALGGTPPYTLRVDYGDGSGDQTAASHTYQMDGDYTIHLWAIDAQGLIGYDQLTVTVMPAYSYLAMNTADLLLSGPTSYGSTVGTASVSFLGLKAETAVDKMVAGVTALAGGTRRITYDIGISTVSTEAMIVPMVDVYDAEAMTYVSAAPPPSRQLYPGLLVWDDITAASPQGLGRDLAPGAPLTVSVVFDVGPKVSGIITNTAAVDGVLDARGYALNGAADNVPLSLSAPGAVVRTPEPWNDVTCAGWRQRFLLLAENVGGVALTDARLVVSLGDGLSLGEADLLLGESSPGAIDEGGGSVSWDLGTLGAGVNVERELVLRPYTSVPEGTQIQVCAVLASDQLTSDPVCYQGDIVLCDVVATPTATGAAPTPTGTAEPTIVPVTPTPSATASPGDEAPCYLPLIAKGT